MSIKFKNNNLLDFIKNHNDIDKVFSKINWSNCKKLKSTNLLSKRISKYRILFLKEINIIYVFYINNRNCVYKKNIKRKYEVKNYEWINYCL